MYQIPTTIEGTAHHEASHAVLAHVTGVYLMEGINLQDGFQAQALMKRDGNLCVARRLDNSGANIDHDLEMSIICAAGLEGERRYLVEQGMPVDENILFLGAHGDVQDVRELIGEGKWLEMCSRAAFYLDQDGIWRAVKLLATELLKRNGVMNADQVSDLLHTASVEFNLPESKILT